MLVQVDVDVPDTDTVLAAVTISVQADGKLAAQFHGDSFITGRSINLIRDLADALELEELVSGM